MSKQPIASFVKIALAIQADGRTEGKRDRWPRRWRDDIEKQARAFRSRHSARVARRRGEKIRQEATDWR